jgi:hypothetical protein
MTTNHKVTAVAQPLERLTSYLHHTNNDQQNVGIMNQRLSKTYEELTINYVPNMF